MRKAEKEEKQDIKDTIIVNREVKVGEYILEEGDKIRLIEQGSYKAIVTEEGPKINLARTSKLYFGIVHEDGKIETLSFKQWLKRPELYKSNDYVEEEMLKELLTQIRNFGDKVDYNHWVKQRERTFIEKLEKLQSMGVKIPKSVRV